MMARKLWFAAALGILFLALSFMVDRQPAKAQPAIPHPTAGREACTLCHVVGGAGVGASGGVGLPEAHRGRTDSQCRGCHQAAATAPAATTTPAPTAAPAALAPAPPPGSDGKPATLASGGDLPGNDGLWLAAALAAAGSLIILGSFVLGKAKGRS